jgi:hypothetical protein
MTGFKLFICSLFTLIAVFLIQPVSVFAAKDTSFSPPKEYGVYAKTAKGLMRILPNIVTDQDDIFYLESNKPQQFPLGAIEYFIIHGQYQFEYLTLNPMVPFRMSSLGVPRFMFGKEIEITITKKSDITYIIKPKGLFGRGYYALWIEDSAWDFVIE